MNTFAKPLDRPLNTNYSTEHFLSLPRYNKKMQRIKTAITIISLATVVIASAGIVATTLTGCLPLIAIPVIAMLTSVVLLTIIYKLRPRISPDLSIFCPENLDEETLSHPLINSSTSGEIHSPSPEKMS